MSMEAITLKAYRKGFLKEIMKHSLGTKTIAILLTTAR